MTYHFPLPLFVYTTDITDDEIYQYHLNLKENVPTRRLTKLPSSSKNGATFRHATCYNSSFSFICELFVNNLLVIFLPVELK